METVSVSLEVLCGILGKNAQELQSALMIEKDGTKVPIDQKQIDTYVSTAGSARLTELKDDGKKEFISQGRRLAFKDVEKHIADTYGIKAQDEDGWWKKGMTEVMETAKTKAQTTEEAVKASELYKALEGKYTGEVNSHQQTKQGFKNRIIQDAFHREIKNALSDKSLNLALPEDETILNTQIKGFAHVLEGQAKLDMIEDGSVIPLNQEGKQLEDPNFNKITLKSFIAQNAKGYWPTQVPGQQRQAPPAGDGGTTPPANPNGDPTKFPKWKDGEEFSAFMDKAITENKEVGYLKAAQAAYESQQG